MGVVALLLAFAVGASASTAMTVFGFMAALTTIFAVGTVVAVVVSDSTSHALESTLLLFVLAQVGYGLGLLALAKLDPPSDTTRRRHFRIRK